MTVKPRTNFYLDVLLFILMVTMLLSGLVLWAGIPSGGEGQHQGRRWQDASTVDDRGDVLCFSTARIGKSSTSGLDWR